MNNNIRAHEDYVNWVDR